jgi:crossover junction endonuclease MUS81
MTSISLIIDHREKDLKVAFPNAEYLNLDLGDIKITYNGNLVLLIERKTMNDLIASVNDGRYREQKKRLLESGIPQSKLMYILEGSLNDIPGHLKTLYGMIINTTFRDHLTVLKFEDIDETIFFLKRIIKKLEDKDPSLVSLSLLASNKDENKTEQEGGDDNKDTVNNNLEYLSTIKMKKKDNLTTSNCSILQLAQIPGMSIQNANIILDKYKSIANLIKSYFEIEESKRIKMLMDLEIPISNGKKRKLGPILSERIYNYLFNISTTS